MKESFETRRREAEISQLNRPTRSNNVNVNHSPKTERSSSIKIAATAVATAATTATAVRKTQVKDRQRSKPNPSAKSKPQNRPWRYNKTQKYCVTCMHWVGQRELTSCRTGVLSERNSRGKCLHEKKRTQPNQTSIASCPQWTKMPGLK